jgi:hypothetical protein
LVELLKKDKKPIGRPRSRWEDTGMDLRERR